MKHLELVYIAAMSFIFTGFIGAIFGQYLSHAALVIVLLAMLVPSKYLYHAVQMRDTKSP